MMTRLSVSDRNHALWILQTSNFFCGKLNVIRKVTMKDIISRKAFGFRMYKIACYFYDIKIGALLSKLAVCKKPHDSSDIT